MKYVIKLAEGKGYLCHAGRNRVVIYDSKDDPNLRLDLAQTGGKLRALQGDTLSEVYLFGWYDNDVKEIEDPVQSLSEFAGFYRDRDDPTIYTD